MTPKLLTLVLVEKEGQLLLGMKKRGFGAGRWNGFGGKVNEGETVEEAAVRETKEESNITPKALNARGVLTFMWQGRPDTLEVHVFKASNYDGEPQETEEMRPKWFNVSEIPYDEMWTDDKYWLPLYLAGKKFKGQFLFDDKDQVLSHEIEIKD